MHKNKLKSFFTINGMFIIPIYLFILLFSYKLYVDNISYLIHINPISVIILYLLVLFQFYKCFNHLKKWFILFALLLFNAILIPYDIIHPFASFVHVASGYSAVIVLNIMMFYSYFDLNTIKWILFISLIAGLHIMLNYCITGLSEIIYLSGISFIVTNVKRKSL